MTQGRQLQPRQPPGPVTYIDPFDPQNSRQSRTLTQDFQPRPLPEGDYDVLTASDGQQWVVPTQRSRAPQTVITNHYYGHGGPVAPVDWDDDEEPTHYRVRSHMRRYPAPREPEREDNDFGKYCLLLLAMLVLAAMYFTGVVHL